MNLHDALESIKANQTAMEKSLVGAFDRGPVEMVNLVSELSQMASLPPTRENGVKNAARMRAMDDRMLMLMSLAAISGLHAPMRIWAGKILAEEN